MRIEPASGNARPYRRADDGASILVVEDVPTTLEFMRTALTSHGYQVRTATTVEEAQTELARALPDLVVLDLFLPDAHGLDICRQLRGDPEADDIPVLIVTTDDRPAGHGEAVRAGADDFLRKPILAAELQTRVRSLLRVRRLRRELKHQTRDLLALQDQREEMLQFLMHDLKNMLGSVLAGVQLMQADDGPGRWELHKQRLGASTRTLQEMLTSFLDLSIATRNELAFHPEPLDTETFMGQALQEFHDLGTLGHHAVELAVEAAGTFRGDPDLLRRVLYNLLENACRYSPRETVVQVALARTGAGILISVADQGQGIPDSQKAHVFDRLFRGQGHTGRSGRGLGLAFCKLAVELHQGTLKVEDNQPRGTRFIVQLPG